MKKISYLLIMAFMCAMTFVSCDENDNPVGPSVQFTYDELTLKVGEMKQNVAITNSMAMVTYESSDKTVATVTRGGYITAVGEGEAYITATVPASWTYPAGSATCLVKVVNNVQPAAEVTTDPTATASIIVGTATDLVTAGVADGGTMMYEVTATNTKPTSLDGFSATIPTAATLAMGTYYVWYYAKGDDDHTDSEIAASPVEVTIKPGLITPLTLEAITAGTITVTSPKAGMQYSLNGGAKTAVPDGTPIDVAVGDKVAFYGNGTSIDCYVGTRIAGGTADIKVYGNIMSLVDETGFATNTTLTGSFAFVNLFSNNAQLTDASGLLLPATTLTGGCYGGMFAGCSSLTTAPALPATTLDSDCYSTMFAGCSSLTTAPALDATDLASNCYLSMFNGCSSLTTAPALPATTLASNCYAVMFKDCSSLTTAYVKAAFTNVNNECLQMFDGCTAAGAVLHTTTANQGSWDTVMGSGKTWSTWTTAADWTD